LKRVSGAAFPFVGEHQGFGLALGVIDQAALTETVHRVPLEGLPRPGLAVVVEEGQPQQRHDRLLYGGRLGRAPKIPETLQAGFADRLYQYPW